MFVIYMLEVSFLFVFTIAAHYVKDCLLKGAVTRSVCISLFLKTQIKPHEVVSAAMTSPV